MSKTKQIDKLTPVQEAKIPEYIEKFLSIGLDTTPCDHVKAEEAITKCMAHLKKTPKEFVWVDSPYAGVKLAAELHYDSKNPTTEQIRSMSQYSFYGSFESYWVAFYDFIAKELPVPQTPLTKILVDVVENTGVHWVLENGTVVCSEKPVTIHFKDKKLHNPNGLALEYKDGTGIFALNGVKYPSMIEMVIQNEAKGVSLE